MSKIIEVKNLNKSYRNTKAVQNISFSVSDSKIFALLGPNGAGKSSVINMLAGIIAKSDGEIYMFEKKIRSNDYKYKKKIGFVLETPHYLEKLTAREYLYFAGSLYKLKNYEIERRVNELIDFFNLKESENKWIENYSTGMKKKVSLAASIIHNPDLLILDEPLEGLDPISAIKVKEVLRHMVTKGATVFITSHNLDAVEKYCDEVAIINKGKLVYQASTRELKKKIKNELSGEIYQSLEEIFIDVVSDDQDKIQASKLSWM